MPFKHTAAGKRLATEQPPLASAAHGALHFIFNGRHNFKSLSQQVITARRRTTRECGSMNPVDTLPQGAGKRTSRDTFAQLANLVCSSFDGIEFAVCFGSVARGEYTVCSDIDLMVVLTNRPSNQAVKHFCDTFAEFQLGHGFRPDYRFPAEIISGEQLLEAIRWRGIERSGNTPVIRPLGPDDWTPENEYRQWLTAAAGPNLFVCGKRAVYQQARDCAMASCILLTLLSGALPDFTPSQVVTCFVAGGKERLGFISSPGTTAYLRRSIPRALQLLKTLGAVQRMSGRYRLSDGCDGAGMSASLSSLVHI